MGLTGLILADYGVLWGILSGLTESTDHPSRTEGKGQQHVKPPFLNLVHAPGIHSRLANCYVAVEARKLEHDRPATLNQRKKEYQHKPSYIHVPTSWSQMFSCRD